MHNPSQPTQLHSIEVLPPVLSDALYLPLTYSTSKPRINWDSLQSFEQIPSLVEPLLPERPEPASNAAACKIGSNEDVLLGFVSDQAHILLGELAKKLVEVSPSRNSSNFSFDFTSAHNSYGSVVWNSISVQYEVSIHPCALVVCSSIHSFTALLAHEIGHTMIPRCPSHPGGGKLIKELFYELQAYYSEVDTLDLSLLSTLLSPEQMRELEVPYVVRTEKRQELEAKTKMLEEGLLLLSRQNEHTADLTACDILHAAGLRPRGLIELHEQIRPYREPSPTTHPSFYERIRMAAEHIASLPKVAEGKKDVWRRLEQDYYYLRLQTIPVILRELHRT